MRGIQPNTYRVENYPNAVLSRPIKGDERKRERNRKGQYLTLKTMKSLNPAVMFHVVKIDVIHCIEG